MSQHCTRVQPMHSRFESRNILSNIVLQEAAHLILVLALNSFRAVADTGFAFRHVSHIPGSWQGET